MNYYKKTIKIENLSLGSVFTWIAEHPYEHLDHTYFQDTDNSLRYSIVSETGDDCGIEKNVSFGLDEWRESGIDGVLFNEDRNIGCVIVKANGTYYQITHGGWG